MRMNSGAGHNHSPIARGVVAIAVCIWLHGGAGRAGAWQPLPPQEALAHFKIEPGLAIEIVACEPQIVDPIDIRFDEQGRLWVVEMRDYPHGPAAGEQPKSRISLLEDEDGDGFFETARVFADKLLFPTGLQPW